MQQVLTLGHRIIQKKFSCEYFFLFFEKYLLLQAEIFFFYSFCHLAYFISKKLFPNFGRLYLGQKTTGEAIFASPVGLRHT